LTGCRNEAHDERNRVACEESFVLCCRSCHDLPSSQRKPGGGAGARYMIDDKRGINLSVDYAVGKDSDAVYFRIGEAF